ncbi:cell division protein DedD [Streptomyces sp. NPDC091377]|uniref:cell division protein DedD n=1 Tax=Streptomyces sp. NPDC091377 TaxID=3365995 RepID=UPI0038135ADA
MWALGIADAVSTRGDCTRSQVGAILMDQLRNVCAVGYSGTVPGKDGCLKGRCPRGRLTYDQMSAGSDYGNCISIHAEENLMIHARREDLRGGTFYVTRAPCCRCHPHLQSAGVRRGVRRTQTGYEPRFWTGG